MSYYRVETGAKVGGAHRPWLLGDKAAAGDKAGETDRQRKERETCLTCELPACNQEWSACPLRKAAGKRMWGSVPPPEFLRQGSGPMTDRLWAEKLGVSKQTVRRWREKYGIYRSLPKRRGGEADGDIAGGGQ